MKCSTTAVTNIALGQSSGRCITSGCNNITIGSNTGCLTGTCRCNIFIGHNAGNKGGSSINIAIGPLAGKNLGGAQGGADSDSRGGTNIMIGQCSGSQTSTGGSVIYMGALSGQCNINGTCTIAIGRGAGIGDTNGTANVYIGNHAGGQTCGGTSQCNIAIGYGAGAKIFTGVQNVFLGGYFAGGCTVNGSCNIALGRRAGLGNTSGRTNVYIGACSGPKTCGASGSCNIILGMHAGCDLTSGGHNIFLGRQSGNTNTSGSRNIAIGDDVELPSATGDDQLAIGCGTGRWVAGDSSFNVTLAGIVTATAAGAVCATTYHGDGSNLTGVGGTANVSTIGLVVAGLSTFHNNVELLSMDDGSAAAPEFILNRHSASPADADYLGNIKFQGKQDGGGTVNYAKISGKILDASNGTEDGILEFMIRKNGSNNIAARFRSDSLQLLNDTAFSVAGDITANGNIAGDSSTNITGIADITASGTVQAGNFDSTSDVRLKTNIQPIDDPIAKVIQIEGVSFNWKKDNRPALGVIADQVQEILPELVHGDDPKTVNYNGLVGLLIEVVKDQQKQIDSLNDRISKLE